MRTRLSENAASIVTSPPTSVSLIRSKGAVIPAGKAVDAAVEAAAEATTEDTGEARAKIFRLVLLVLDNLEVGNMM
jgi:hypothetical protein